MSNPTEVPAKNYTHLYTGRIFRYARKDNDVCLTDIAHHIGKINRFSGATNVFYSVAQHSLLVERILKDMKYGPRMRLKGLLHDAHEMVTNDIPTPFHWEVTRRISEFIRLRFGEDVVYDPIAEIKDDIDENIFTQHGLSSGYTQVEKFAIKFADMKALITEAQHLLDPVPPWSKEWGLEPHDIVILPMTWEQSTDAFIKRYYEVRAETSSAGHTDFKNRVQQDSISAQ